MLWFLWSKYKWLQMKLENKCKISTHFFSRMVKCQPSQRILLLSRFWCTCLPITLYLYHRAVERVYLSKTFQEYFWSYINLRHSEIMETKVGNYSSYWMKEIPIYYCGEQVLLPANLLISFSVSAPFAGFMDLTFIKKIIKTNRLSEAPSLDSRCITKTSVSARYTSKTPLFLLL